MAAERIPRERLTPEQREELKELLGEGRPSLRVRKSKSSKGVRSTTAQSRGRGYVPLAASQRAERVQGRQGFVKVRYQENSAGWKAHARYLTQDAKGLAGEPVKVFSETREDVALEPLVQRWAGDGDPRLFKLVLSPERHADLDLKRMTRALMAQMSEDMGCELNWAAAIHTDTDTPHVHVVLRGVDEQGKAFRIAPDYASRGLRVRLSNWLTSELGLKSEREMVEQLDVQVEAQRLTNLDKTLLRMAREDLSIVFKAPKRRDPLVLKRQDQLKRRLRFLQGMGLAGKDMLGDWKLEPHMTRMLKAYGASYSITHAKSRGLAWVSDENAPLVSTRLYPGTFVAGKVLSVGVDEAVDRVYALVEGVDGRIHYCLEQTPRSDRIKLYPGRTYSFEVKHDPGQEDVPFKERAASLHIQQHEPSSPELVQLFLKNHEHPGLIAGKSYAAQFLRTAWAEAQARRRVKGLEPLPEKSLTREDIEAKPKLERRRPVKLRVRENLRGTRERDPAKSLDPDFGRGR